MIEEVVPDRIYESESGFLFIVTGLAKHGQDCSYPQVVYTNLEPTKDMPAGQSWVIAESIFMKRFSELNLERLGVPNWKNEPSGRILKRRGLVFFRSYKGWLIHHPLTFDRYCK